MYQFVGVKVSPIAVACEKPPSTVARTEMAAFGDWPASVAVIVSTAVAATPPVSNVIAYDVPVCAKWTEPEIEADESRLLTASSTLPGPSAGASQEMSLEW